MAQYFFTNCIPSTSNYVLGVNSEIFPQRNRLAIRLHHLCFQYIIVPFSSSIDPIGLHRPRGRNLDTNARKQMTQSIIANGPVLDKIHRTHNDRDCLDHLRAALNIKRSRDSKTLLRKQSNKCHNILAVENGRNIGQLGST